MKTQMPFNNEIEKTKKEIEVLTAKLALLKEMENHKTPCEIAYKDWWGQYPETGTWDGFDEKRWQGFQAGYEFAYAEKVMEKVQEEPEENEWKLVALKLGEKLSDIGPCGYYDYSAGEWFEWALNECEREMIKRNLKTSLQEMVNGDVRPIDDVVKEAKEQQIKEAKEQQIKDAVRESVKWCEEHPDWDLFDCLKPQTPNQIFNYIDDALKEAVKQGVVSSVDKPKDDFMDKMVAELKGQNLTDLIYDWWEDVFTTHSDWDMETSIADLVDQIEQWLPKSQSAAGSQNAYVECTVEGFNDALNKIKRKLR